MRVLVTATAEFDLNISETDDIYDAAVDWAICGGLLQVQSVQILEK